MRRIIDKIRSLYYNYKIEKLKKTLGYCGNNVSFPNMKLFRPQNLFLYDNIHILSGFTFISDKGCFYMKKGSGAAQNLTVITDTHNRHVGFAFKDNRVINGYSDVIVEEDVWIGANVSLLPGVKIGRGANIGTGAVVRNNVPPYSIVVGNPAKVIGFNFTPEEIVEHEKSLYPKDERLPIELLEKNYDKYFLKRLKKIKEITHL